MAHIDNCTLLVTVNYEITLIKGNSHDNLGGTEEQLQGPAFVIFAPRLVPFTT